MSEARYKTITLYFDIRNKDNMDLYGIICKNSKKNKKSSYIINTLRDMFMSNRKKAFTDEACTEIAKKIVEELKPQLALAPVRATETEEVAEEKKNILMNGLDTLCGDGDDEY